MAALVDTMSRSTGSILASRSISGRSLTEAVVRTALRGAAAYKLSWFDTNLWAYAECFGLEELISEDFQHDRLYGSVGAVTLRA